MKSLALADLDRVLQLNPKRYLAYLAHGEIRVEQELLEDAIKDFTMAIKLEPDSPKGYYKRADAWRQLEILDKALADCNEVVRTAPKDSAGYLARARVHFMKDNYAEALADSAESIKLCPSDHTAYSLRALIWATCPNKRFRDGKRAVESARRACELLEWKGPASMTALAAAYAETGNFQEAVRWQAKALELPGAADLIGEKGLAVLKLYREGKPAH